MTIKKCEKLGTIKVGMVLTFMGLEKQMWKALRVVINKTQAFYYISSKSRETRNTKMHLRIKIRILSL